VAVLEVQLAQVQMEVQTLAVAAAVLPYPLRVQTVVQELS
jgi:hypothetical protein